MTSLAEHRSFGLRSEAARPFPSRISPITRQRAEELAQDHPELVRLSPKGGLCLPGCNILASSERLDWDTVFVSHQQHEPIAASIPAQEWHVFLLNLTGPCRLRLWCADKVRKVTAVEGMVTYLPAGQPIRWEPEDQFQSLIVCVSPQLFTMLAGVYEQAGAKAPTPQPILCEQDALLKCLMLETLQAAGRSSEPLTLYAEQLAVAMVSRLFNRNARPCPEFDRAAGKSLTRRALGLIEDHIRANMDSRITIDQLAAIVGCSPSHFFRAFKGATGKSPYNFVLEQRIEKAKSLLRYSDLSIVEIALTCGFSDQEHFSHAFRKHVDTTPRRFRSQLHRG